MSAITFWYVMTIACLVWYSVITLYVAIRGGFDVRSMFRSLEDKRESGADSNK